MALNRIALWMGIKATCCKDAYAHSQNAQITVANHNVSLETVTRWALFVVLLFVCSLLQSNAPTLTIGLPHIRKHRKNAIG